MQAFTRSILMTPDNVHIPNLKAFATPAQSEEDVNEYGVCHNSYL